MHASVFELHSVVVILHSYAIGNPKVELFCLELITVWKGQPGGCHTPLYHIRSVQL